MGLWDDNKDFSAFGIMANTPGPTPDAFLTQQVANQNSNYGNQSYTPLTSIESPSFTQSMNELFPDLMNKLK